MQILKDWNAFSDLKNHCKYLYNYMYIRRLLSFNVTTMQLLNTLGGTPRDTDLNSQIDSPFLH